MRRRATDTNDGVMRQGERGSGVLPLTILLPFVLVGTMLVVQFGLAYHVRTVLSGAVQDGAAAGARRDSSPAQGQAVAQSLINQSGSGLITLSTTSASQAEGRVTMTATAEVVSLIPFIDTFHVEAEASAPVETFRPQGG